MTHSITNDDYKIVFKQAQNLVFNAQKKFIQEANRTSIDLYWELGKLLAKTAEKYQWGKKLLARLSADLSKELYSTHFKVRTSGKQFCCAMSFFDSSNSTSYCEMRKSSVRTKMAARSSHFEVC